LGFSKNKDIFSTFQKICRSYEQTRMYRDIKLRGAIVADKKLSILPEEKFFNRYNGIWNLSKDTGNVGQLYITNVRVVWFANSSENFNISIPYIQINAIKAKKSQKYGQAMVIATVESSGGYYLGSKLLLIEF
jgi:Bardet-Biedl syndrome 5 protein